MIIFHSSFFLFFSLSFFLLHTRTLTLFFFILLSSFFFPAIPPNSRTFQSSPSSSLFFFFFYFLPFLLALRLLVLGGVVDKITGERPIARQRSIWVCFFGQTHIQVSLFSFVDGSEVNGDFYFCYTSKGERGF